MLKLDKNDLHTPQDSTNHPQRVYQVSPEAARTRNQRQVLQEFVNDSLPPLDDQLAQYLTQNEEKKKKNGQNNALKEEQKKLRGYIQNTKFYIFDKDARVSWEVLPTDEQSIHQKKDSPSEFEIIQAPSLMTRLQLEMLAQVSSCLPGVSPVHIKDKILDQDHIQIIITGDVGNDEERKYDQFLAGCVFKAHPKVENVPPQLQKNLGFAELTFFIVHPEYQKLKLGQVLMERLKQFIRDKNAQKKMIAFKEIVVYADNNAIGFFKKQNYRTVPQGSKFKYRDSIEFFFRATLMRYNIENEDKTLNSSKKQSSPAIFGFEEHSDAEEIQKESTLDEINQDNETNATKSMMQQSDVLDSNLENVQPNMQKDHRHLIQIPYRREPHSENQEIADSLSVTAQNSNSNLDKIAKVQNTDIHQSEQTKSNEREKLTALIFSESPNAVSNYLDTYKKPNSIKYARAPTEWIRERNPVRNCQNRDLNKEIHEIEIGTKNYKVTDDDKIVTDLSSSSAEKKKSGTKPNPSNVSDVKKRVMKGRPPRSSWGSDQPAQIKVLKQGANNFGKQIKNSKRAKYIKKAIKPKIERRKRFQIQTSSNEISKKSKKIRKENKTIGLKLRVN